MATKRRQQQAKFEFKSWGGPRKGAGRPRLPGRPRMSHLSRVPLASRFPVHVTVRLVSGLPSLRTIEAETLIREASLEYVERHVVLTEPVKAWLGTPEDPETQAGGVGWIRGIEWMPYQRATFVTPAFAGYVSGHSTFSRAAAEVMTAITGTPFFPGGMGTFVAHAGEYLEFEDGPSETVELQFATYYDAADMAGISRLWGGIHPEADDLPARISGSEVGIRAWERAQDFFGTNPVTICHTPDGNPANGAAIRVAPAAVEDHLAEGDLLGRCKEATTSPPGKSARPGRKSSR